MDKAQLEKLILGIITIELKNEIDISRQAELAKKIANNIPLPKKYK